MASFRAVENWRLAYRSMFFYRIRDRFSTGARNTTISGDCGHHVAENAG